MINSYNRTYSFASERTQSTWTDEQENEWRRLHPREAVLADDLAEMLGDPTALRFFRWCALRFQETFLRTLASHVKALPDENIRVSRGALFTALLKQGGVNAYVPRPRSLQSEHKESSDIFNAHPSQEPQISVVPEDGIPFFETTHTENAKDVSETGSYALSKYPQN